MRKLLSIRFGRLLRAKLAQSPPLQQSDWPWDDVVYAAPILTYNNSLIRIDHPVQASGDTDIRITKFDATGELLWENTYNGPASGNDYGISVIIDNNDNILVLGAVSTSNLTSDFVVLKYNSNGQLLWSFVSDGGDNQLDLPTDIECDDSGNIYFCGGSVNTSSLSDWRIYKLSPNGDLQEITYTCLLKFSMAWHRKCRLQM